MKQWSDVGLIGAVLMVTMAHAAASAVASSLDSYASAARLVEIDGGRRINLRCTGEGLPMVVLEAGGRADSLAWHRVQPLLAGQSTVCSYDRAGYGFSEAGPLPRDLDADVRDLHALVDAAGLAKPLLLVGHSLGSNIVRRYAERHPGDVVGLVLVDPPPQGQQGLSEQWKKDDEAATERRNAMLQACTEAARTGQLATASGALARCIAPADPSLGERVGAAVRGNKLRPAFWETVSSELASNVALFATPVSPSERHAALPIRILVAADAFADVPAPDRAALEALRESTLAAIAGSSTRSERILVEHSSHDMPMDRPDAIVSAVEGLLRERAGR